ncbi:5'-nucleotidase C-terminal domain-containing protein [Fervidibacillus albus]|uniref:5'-nucleotidase C-terminal domain-containing protein n=1 Tax=Fervidibacillus albus TaxID=2980026 RepID=A0A9E8LVU6_9BACI|nr:5'-nucleotidase C-terminal domain-containing protein [Fervidibacillus albus]WAA09729.1 5'-nucleotidase C-terminal domain-containing protein [Fervidibacillus albus]
MKSMKHRSFIFAVIFTLLLNYVVPFTNVSHASEVDAISVEEAIANNSGTATVTGYIIGTVKSWPNFETEEPFSVQTNIVIADDPNETDPSKILPVQLPNNTIRTSFNLVDHPEYLGEKVFITGELTAYFGVPGLKSPTEMWLDGTEPPGDDEDPTPAPSPSISEIQGDGHTSPYKDQNVTDVEGIVTFVQNNNNFYMQSVTPDDNPNTSEGILVYSGGGHSVEVGDIVKVSGTVKEWVITSSKIDIDLPVTEINASNITIEKSDQPLPEPVVLDPPTDVIDNDAFSVFDPTEDAIDYYETLEGMLVSVENPVVVGPQKYGEIPVLTKIDEDKTFTNEGGILLTEETANPERIFIDVFNYDFIAKTGDQFDGTVTGVLSFDYSSFKVLTDEADLPQLIERDYTLPVTTLEGDEDSLTIASYNIENYYQDLTEKTAKIAETVVNNLNSPDIIGLVEMQDNDGPTDSGTTEADENYEALISAIEAAGGPTYDWADVAPADKTDGGQPGGNIRVGFLYNPDRVQLTEGTRGSATEAVDFVDGSLTLNPGRIDPTNPAFDDSRKPIAAQFNFNGEDIIAIVNHFNSKGGDEPLFGINQPPTLYSEIQRIQIAEVVNGFVDNILEDDPDANVVVMGDLNDFQFSNPVKTLQDDVLVNLVNNVPLENRYTYIYEGNSQVLDHILVTHNLADDAEVDIVHLNSAYMEEHGRASDHDPILAQLNFDEEDSSVPTEDFDLTIMHTNDTHAYVEQFPYLSTAVQEIRAENSNNLLLHAGDVFSGTLYYTVYEGLADLEFMNTIGYDAMVFGNHEFDSGSEVLGNFIKEAAFPFVSSNIDFTGDSILGTYVQSNVGQPGENGKIYPAIIKEVDGESIGIIGLTTEETPSISSPDDNVVFQDAIEKAEETVNQLEDMGIDKIIALTHLGYNDDLELAKSVDGIDIIVGGHSHTELADGVLIDEKDEPTIIVQAGENLNNLGKLDVTFDEDGVIIDYDAELLNLEEYEKDAALQEKVDEYTEGLEDLLKEVVGETKVTLDGEREDVRTKETNLGNLITDGMVWKMQQFNPDVTIALQNGGGIRASIDAGEITMGEVRTVLPFNNTLVYMELTGDEIWQALEHSVSEYPEANGGFLHVSGLKFTFDPEKPVGERVVSVYVKNADNEYVPIDINAMYFVATNSFIAKGGDGYDMLAKATEEGRMTNIDIPDYVVLSDYLKYLDQTGQDIPTVEGRITALGQDSGDDQTPGDDDQSNADDETPGDDQTSGDDQTPGDDTGTSDKTDSDKELPNTATNIWNFLFIGMSLIMVSLILFIYYRRQKRFI